MSFNFVDYQGECEQHGPFTGRIMTGLKSEIRSGCPVCSEEKRIEREAEEAEQRRKDAEESRKRYIAGKLKSAAIPPRFQGKSFSDYVADTDKQAKALAVCTEYAESFDSHYDAGRCLLLMGKPGCGKTHLAAAIAAYLCENTRYFAVYRTLPGLIQEIRATYGQDSEQSEADILHAVTSCALLVLDEIAATESSEFELSLLFNVINTRYEQKLPTLIVSNLAPAELGSAIGDRCVDRLREGGGIVVAFDWESSRRQIK